MAPKNRAEYQELLAKEFLTCLSQKGLDWKKGWNEVASAPCNAVTNAPYHGVNQFYLGLLALTRGYTDPRWATMNQIMDRSGTYHPGQQWHLQKGSKAVYVEYWYVWDPAAKQTLPWSEYRRLTPDEQRAYSLRVRYTPVFHASMIDGLEPLRTPAREERRLDGLVPRLSEGMGVEILFDGGGRAFYRPSEDKIHLPPRSAFVSEYELNATALHELAHATGHPTRLDRPMAGRFGTREYAYEELVAEISSCFMGVALDAEQTPSHVENHKAYVQSWIADIANKTETLIEAIRDAQTAVQYMEYHGGLTQERVQETARRQEQKNEAPQEQAAPTPPVQRSAQSRQERPWSPVTRSGKLHFTDEQYKTAREASALEYARRQGYSLVKEGSRYHMAEHDSMIFLPNGQWHWNSHALHGGAIEFLIHYENKTLPEAVLALCGVDHERGSIRTAAAPEAPYAASREDLEAAAQKVEFVLPPRAERMNRLFSYLCRTRGLDYGLVRQLVHDGLIYESVNRRPDGSELHNAVFVGHDAQGVPRSAFLRGCGQNSTFKMEQPGSDKAWPFTIPGDPNATTLYVFEAAIDAASHATLQRLAGLTGQNGPRISLGGNAPQEALFHALDSCPAVNSVCICTDGDAAGGAIAKKLKEDLVSRGFPERAITRAASPAGKDWNEYLQAWRRVVERHELLPTTEFADKTPGECCGRIHFLDPNTLSPSRTVAYTDRRHFTNAAAYYMRRLEPCVVETPAQLDELQRLLARRAARQTAALGGNASGETPDYLRADGEPDLDREISRQRLGFRDGEAPEPDPGQRLDMGAQLASAAREAEQRNAERRALHAASITQGFVSREAAP